MTMHPIFQDALRGFAPKSLTEESRFTRDWRAKDEEVRAAYERIDELEAALRGMVGLIHLLNGNDDIPQQVRWHMFKNHRVIEAEEVLS